MDSVCLESDWLELGLAVNVGESFYHSYGQQKNLSQPPLELCVSQCDNPILIQDQTHSETKMEFRSLCFGNTGAEDENVPFLVLKYCVKLEEIQVYIS